MKYFIFSGFIIISVTSFAQQATVDFPGMMNSSNANFYDIQQAARNFYSTVEDDEEGAGFGQYARWEIFWQSRVDKIGQPPGSFQYAFDAVQSIMQEKVCNSSSIIGSDWQPLGPFTYSPPGPKPNMGMIISVKTDPINDNIIYAGSSSAGLWKTNLSNAPITWECLTENTRLPALGIIDIAITYPSVFIGKPLPIIYLATGQYAGGYGIGILKSIDGGSTWEQKGPPGISLTDNVARKILINPNNPDIVFALIGIKVFKTIDGGNSWTDISPSNFNAGIGDNPCWLAGYSRVLVDIEMMPGVPNTLFISTNDEAPAIVRTFCPDLCNNPPNSCVGNNGSLVYKTNDGGDTWEEIDLESGNGSKSTWIGLASTPADPNVIYVAYSYITGVTCNYPNSFPTTSISKIKKIDSSGTIISNVTPTGNFFRMDTYYHSFEISPTDEQIIFAVSYSNYGLKSPNGGSSFTSLSTSNQHVDLRAIHIIDNNNILFGNDGGVSMTTDGGTTWSSINGTGLAITQFYRLGGSEIIPDLVAGGAQDNVIYANRNTGWYNIVPPFAQDGAEVVIDLNNPNILYCQRFCCSWNSQPIKKYFFNGIDWIFQVDLQPLCTNDGVTFFLCPGNFLIPMQMHKNNYLYVGYADLYKSLTPDITWTKISNFSQYGDTPNIQSFDISMSNPNIIYLSHSNTLFKTTSGGGLNSNNWQNITQNIIDDVGYLPGFTDIVVHPENSEKVWIAIGGFGDDGTTGVYNGKGRVIKSTDGGQSWDDYSKNLTQFPVNSIVYEKGTDDGLYIATDVGVFYTNNKIYPTDGWVCFSENMPVVMVWDIEINYASNELRAATFGRGIWKSHLACPSDENLALTNTDNLNNKFYEAKNNITISASTGNISATNLNVRAGNEIVVGVTGTNEVVIGPESHLFIHKCDQPGNSFRRAAPGADDNTTEGQSSKAEKMVIDTIQTQLLVAYPNPFSDHTHINYDVKENGFFNISVHNICGKKVATIVNSKNHQPGQYTSLLDAANLPAGIYYIILQTEKENITQKAIKMK